MNLDREKLQKFYDEAPEGESGDVVRLLANALMRVETFLDEQVDFASTMAEKAYALAILADVRAEPGSIMGKLISSTKEMANAILSNKPIEVIEGDGVHFELKKTYWAIRVIGGALLRSMQKPDGSLLNAVEIQVTTPEMGDVLITAQRKSGKTPLDLLHEQEKRATVAEDKLRLLGENLGNVVAKMAHVGQPYVKETMKDLIGAAKRLLGQFA